ncbi:MAG TPA: MFS transporter, partial [Betaproteobacteria bacterium]|nr:MFS transporter [Betaproteobacteria bacterium]
LLLPASLALIRVVWPNRAERGRVLGIWAGCNGLALATGPTFGGLLIERFGWRSLFFIVVPLGFAAFASAVLTIPESSDPHERHFDASGQILGVAALGGLTFAAIEMHRAHWIALLALAAALLALVLFIMSESKKGAAALVPLALFRTREFLGAAIATTGMTFGMYGVLFLLPLVWQSTGVFGPAGAGVALMPMALVFVLVSPFSGALSRAIGARSAGSGGVVVIGLGLLALSASAGGKSLVTAEFGLVLTGIGMGFATAPLLDLAVGAVPAARSGSAAALINVARMAGATIGVAVLGAVFSVAHSSADGLRYAMWLGGGVQLVCAAVAAAIARPIAAPAQ